MALNTAVSSLRCRLCRNGLLDDFEVYSRSEGPFGTQLPPVLFAYTSGYFYSKNNRHLANVIEIAGYIPESTCHNFRLLAFDDNASAGDLILIGGVFYRAACVRDISPSCRIIDLEADSVEAQN